MQETLATTIGENITDDMFNKSVKIYDEIVTIYLAKH